MRTNNPQPRLGAAYVTERTSPGVRVFGVVSEDGTAAGLRPITERVRTFNSGCAGCEHLWMIGSTAREALRWSPEPSGPQALSHRDSGRQSVMRLRIVTSGSALGTTYEVDLGQSLELVAESLYVEMLAPEGSVEVIDGGGSPQEGLLFDSLCLVRLLRLETSRGLSSAQLTETVRLQQNTSHTLRVPAGARRLSLYGEFPNGVHVARWLRGVPGSASVLLGIIHTTFGLPRWDIDVPSASHIRIEPYPGVRTFTFVWTIVP